MTLVQSVVAVVRFLLDLALVFAYFVIGRWFEQPWSFLISFGASTAAVFVWGMYIAPRAPRRIREPWRAILEIVLFGAAIVGLVAIGFWTWGLSLFALFVVDRALLWFAGGPPTRARPQVPTGR